MGRGKGNWFVNEHLVQIHNPPSIKKSSYGADGRLRKSCVLLDTGNMVTDLQNLHDYSRWEG